MAAQSPSAIVSQRAVSPPEAAQILGVTPPTIYHLMAKGELPSFKIGRLRRIRVQDIDAWMTEQIEKERHNPKPLTVTW